MIFIIIESISPIFALENQPFYLRFYGINFQTFINDNKYQNKINILSKCIFGKENYKLFIINNNEAFCLIRNSNIGSHSVGISLDGQQFTIFQNLKHIQFFHSCNIFLY